MLWRNHVIQRELVRFADQYESPHKNSPSPKLVGEGRNTSGSPSPKALEKGLGDVSECECMVR